VRASTNKKRLEAESEVTEKGISASNGICIKTTVRAEIWTEMMLGEEQRKDKVL